MVSKHLTTFTYHAKEPESQLTEFYTSAEASITEQRDQSYRHPPALYCLKRHEEQSTFFILLLSWYLQFAVLERQISHEPFTSHRFLPYSHRSILSASFVKLQLVGHKLTHAVSARTSLATLSLHLSDELSSRASLLIHAQSIILASS